VKKATASLEASLAILEPHFSIQTLPMKPKFIDLFAGAGGLSEGLSEAGFTGLFSNEFVKDFAETYKINHPEALVDTSDVRTLDPVQTRIGLRLERGELDLVAGGPPCQGFSINAPVRSLDDLRNHLFADFLRFADAFLPRAILIENVPGLVSFESGLTLRSILDSLADMGYGAGVRILGAPHYGIPQMRWRTFIIALRGRSLPSSIFPEPLCQAPVRANFASTFNGGSLLKLPSPKAGSGFVTVRDAIGDLPPLKNGENGARVKGYATGPLCGYQRRARLKSKWVVNHDAPRLSDINMRRLRFIKPGGNWIDIPRDLLPKGMKRARKSDHTKRYGRAAPDGLACTILTKCDPHWGAYFHYSQDRAFSVREAARLQSFPDHYVFTGSLTRQFAQVGNAVPPLLAKSVGIAIKSALE
jgi:DNA (cytosine-5)-methyltransferase 1